MTLIDLLPAEWKAFLELEVDFFRELDEKLIGQEINPEYENIFSCFKISPNKVKVVIVGQDPYPKPDFAMGLAFSVKPNIEKLPFSLRNIKKELECDLQIQLSKSGDLRPWLEDGVLLLNRVLTTRRNESMAHANLGWQDFTDLVIQKLSTKKVVFILWGNYAQELNKYIDPKKLIKGVHPSPLSAHRGFFGSKPFSKANEILREMGLEQINWKI